MLFVLLCVYELLSPEAICIPGIVEDIGPICPPSSPDWFGFPLVPPPWPVEDPPPLCCTPEVPPDVTEVELLINCISVSNCNNFVFAKPIS